MLQQAAFGRHVCGGAGCYMTEDGENEEEEDEEGAERQDESYDVGISLEYDSAAKRISDQRTYTHP